MQLLHALANTPGISMDYILIWTTIDLDICHDPAHERTDWEEFQKNLADRLKSLLQPITLQGELHKAYKKADQSYPGNQWGSTYVQSGSEGEM